MSMSYDSRAADYRAGLMDIINSCRDARPRFDFESLSHDNPSVKPAYTRVLFNKPDMYRHEDQVKNLDTEIQADPARDMSAPVLHKFGGVCLSHGPDQSENLYDIGTFGPAFMAKEFRALQIDVLKAQDLLESHRSAPDTALETEALQALLSRWQCLTYSGFDSGKACSLQQSFENAGVLTPTGRRDLLDYMRAGCGAHAAAWREMEWEDSEGQLDYPGARPSCDAESQAFADRIARGIAHYMDAHAAHEAGEDGMWLDKSAVDELDSCVRDYILGYRQSDNAINMDLFAYGGHKLKPGMHTFGMTHVLPTFANVDFEPVRNIMEMSRVGDYMAAVVPEHGQISDIISQKNGDLKAAQSELPKIGLKGYSLMDEVDAARVRRVIEPAVTQGQAPQVTYSRPVLDTNGRMKTAEMPVKSRDTRDLDAAAAGIEQSDNLGPQAGPDKD